MRLAEEVFALIAFCFTILFLPADTGEKGGFDSIEVESDAQETGQQNLPN
jgi:hypothetical protein